MTTKVYEWGSEFGTSTGGGGGTATPSSGPPEVYTGTLAGLTTITFSAETISIRVANTDDTNAMQLSLDGGATWLTLIPYQILQDNVAVTSLQLQPVAGSPTYEVLATLSTT